MLQARAGIRLPLVRQRGEAVVWDAVFDYAPGATLPACAGGRFCEALPTLAQ